jgi:hypothetical protein
MVSSLLVFAMLLILASRTEAIIPAVIALGMLCGPAVGPILSLPALVLEPGTRRLVWAHSLLLPMLVWSGTDARRQIRDVGRQRRCGVRFRCRSSSSLSRHPVGVSPFPEQSADPCSIVALIARP